MGWVFVASYTRVAGDNLSVKATYPGSDYYTQIDAIAVTPQGVLPFDTHAIDLTLPTAAPLPSFNLSLANVDVKGPSGGASGSILTTDRRKVSPGARKPVVIQTGGNIPLNWSSSAGTVGEIAGTQQVVQFNGRPIRMWISGRMFIHGDGQVRFVGIQPLFDYKRVDTDVLNPNNGTSWTVLPSSYSLFHVNTGAGSYPDAYDGSPSFYFEYVLPAVTGEHTLSWGYWVPITSQGPLVYKDPQIPLQFGYEELLQDWEITVS
jgi:hypothetical protein